MYLFLILFFLFILVITIFLLILLLILLLFCFLGGRGAGHSTLVGFTLAIPTNVQENLEDDFLNQENPWNHTCRYSLSKTSQVCRKIGVRGQTRLDLRTGVLGPFSGQRSCTI